MPYKKNYHRRRPKGKSLAQVSKKLDRLARVTKPEIKEHYGNLASGSVDHDGSVSILNNVPVGNTDETRIGTKVQSLKLDYRGTVTATGVDSSLVRIIFYKDKVNSVSLPLTVLRYAGTDQAINSPISDDQRNSFIILSDRTYKVVPNASNDKVTFHIKKKLNFPTMWADSGTQVGNAVKMLAISDHASASSNKPLLKMAGSFLYTDC